MIEFWNTVTDLYSPEYIKNNALNKSYILEKLFTELDFAPKTLAFLSYNPVIEILSDHYDVHVSDEFKNQIQSSKINTFNLDNCSVKFDAVIGLDEYLTYFNDEHIQRAQLEKISKITGHWFITTLADYKNACRNSIVTLDARFTKHNCGSRNCLIPPGRHSLTRIAHCGGCSSIPCNAIV